jgi:FtsH-binding integral membrane protein
MKTGHTLSIWFFIGLSLLVNGVLILGAGLYELIRPPEYQVVLYRLHASIWWGALLLIIGAVYCYRFSPRRDATPQAALTKATESEEIHVH